MRNALLRALVTPASFPSSTATSTRSFATLLNAQKTITSSSSLTRTQRSAAILSHIRRTYATTDDAKAAAESAQKTASETVDAAKETLASNAGSATNEAQDTAKYAQNSAETFTDALKDGGESITSKAKDAIGAVGDRMSQVADRAPRASSAQSSPIREEPVRTPAKEGSSGANLYIGNLYFEVTGDSLRQEFEKYGAVKSAKVIMDGRGLSKG